MNNLDSRYAINKEWSGLSKQVWVVRFLRDYVGGSSSKAEAEKIAQTHNKNRIGE